MAITQKAIDGFFSQGPFCVHMGVVFQKNALPTLLQFARVRRTQQLHVLKKYANIRQCVVYTRSERQIGVSKKP